ncbi:Uncharacterized protein APZ42_028494 [Daphnia magna]|uniref:Uncharacterized protein n=1 Tax=Daphnia magna TaxID=35525 RepID=A0A164QGH1_9CRUS|nr:Uncharacterized protein APZ42_028494 [Daphnia magna]
MQCLLLWDYGCFGVAGYPAENFFASSLALSLHPMFRIVSEFQWMIQFCGIQVSLTVRFS